MIESKNQITAQQKDFFEEFGDILTSRHDDSYIPWSANTILIDEPSAKFAKYLRAARANAGLSQKELSRSAGISEAEVIALEHGLILSTRIRPKLLDSLAKALDERTENFALILECAPPPPKNTLIGSALTSLEKCMKTDILTRTSQ